jgi:hypothetical protein
MRPSPPYSQWTSPPLPRCLFLPSPCQFCKKAAVAALFRCPSCMQPRYCSTKCRRKDTAHATDCGWKNPSREHLLPPEEVLLYTRPCNGTWALMQSSQVRVIRPLRHPRLHPLWTWCTLSWRIASSLTPLCLEGDSLPCPSPGHTISKARLALDRRCLRGKSAYQHGTTQGTVSRTTREPSSPCLSSSTALDVTEADSGEDLQEAEPNQWDLSLSHEVRWWDWCLPPSPQIAALASSISKGATAPISTCTLLGNEWVGDSVIEATVHLLSPFCRVGTTLLAPSTLANLLHEGARANRWLPILAASSTVAPSSCPTWSLVSNPV